MEKPAPQRVKIFVDFWNYELSMKKVDSSFRTDWFSLPSVLLVSLENLIKPPHGVINQGVHVYGSYHPQTELPLHRWATTTLAGFPSYSVSFNKRQKKKSGPTCPSCHEECNVCPVCGNTMLGFGEKGVDTRIATEMVKFAWEDAYDIALLVSSDRDFVPAIDLLRAKGKMVVHGAFPPKGMVLTNACWGKIDLPSLREQFSR